MQLESNISSTQTGSYTNLINSVENATNTTSVLKGFNASSSVILELVKKSTEVNVSYAKNNLTEYMDTFIISVQNETATCTPLYQVYQNVGDILCKQVMNPVHAIWLSLGWCLVFFVPMIVFAVKLEKYFRKMDKD